MQRETRFKHLVLSFLRSLPNTWVTKIQQVGIRGTPDILGVINGYFIAIELKSSDLAHTSALQDHNLSEIRKSGGISFVMTPETWFKDRETLKSLSEDFMRKVQ